MVVVVVLAGIRITEVLRHFMMEPPIIMFFELETSDLVWTLEKKITQ